MKKSLTAIALALAIGIFATQSADARWGQGNGSGPGSCGNCDQEATVDAETRQAFFEATQDLRTELIALRTEYFALTHSEDPDKEAAQVVWGEMFDLQQEIQEIAAESGITPGTGRNAGNGRGCGSGRGGYGASAGCNGQGCSQLNNNTATE